MHVLLDMKQIYHEFWSLFLAGFRLFWKRLITPNSPGRVKKFKLQPLKNVNLPPPPPPPPFSCGGS